MFGKTQKKTKTKTKPVSQEELLRMKDNAIIDEYNIFIQSDSHKEDELLLNNPFVYEPLRLLNYNVDKINLTQEMIASAEFILAQNKRSKNNFALAQCIHNKIIKNPPLRNLYISGVGDIKKLSNGDRTIYLFSDMDHTSLERCVPSVKANGMDSFLKYITQTTSKFIDVFIEMPPPIYNDADFINGFALKTHRLFYNCTKKELRNKTKLCVPNMRLHWTDVRGYIQSYFTDSTFLEKIKQLLEITKNSEIFPDYVVDNFEKNKFVTKELDKLDSEYMRLIINGIISEYQKNIHYYFFDIQDVYDNFIRGNFNLSETQQKNLYSAILYINAHIMDLYLFARLFKNYDTKNTFEPTYAKFSIIYAGGTHTDIYEKVLTEHLGFRVLEQDIGITDSCTVLHNIKLPFFT